MTMPSSFAMGRSRGFVEVLQLIRQKDAIIFTFAFPALLTILLGLIFDTPVEPRIRHHAQPGLRRRHDRLRHPLHGLHQHGRRDRRRPRGRHPQTPARHAGHRRCLLHRQDRPGVLRRALEVLLLLLVGVLMFDLPLPSGSRWLTFAWLLVLSVVACTLLGIAASPSLVRPAAPRRCSTCPCSSCSSVRHLRAHRGAAAGDGQRLGALPR